MKRDILEYIGMLKVENYSMTTFMSYIKEWFKNEYTVIELEKFIIELEKNNIISYIYFDNFQIVCINKKKVNRINKLHKIIKADV